MEYDQESKGSFRCRVWILIALGSFGICTAALFFILPLFLAKSEILSGGDLNVTTRFQGLENGLFSIKMHEFKF